MLKKLKATLTGSVFLAGSLMVAGSIAQADIPAEVQWMQDAKWGIGHHYLAGGALNKAYYNIQDYHEWNNYIKEFDVDAYAELAKKMGVGYVVFTITQNRGYLATTSKLYDQHAPACPAVTKGCRPQPNTKRADYTPERDLVLDLGVALKAKGIKLITYLPYHIPNRWAGYEQKPTLAPKWYIDDFITERAQAWGDNVAGWWFDGYYDIIKREQNSGFPIGDTITRAVKRGNPNAAITFNRGTKRHLTFTTHTPYANYTAGEFNSLPPVPASGEVSGYNGKTVLWNSFTFLSKHHPLFAGWGQVKRNLKYANDTVASRAKAIADAGGVSTWDTAINPNGTLPVDKIVLLQTIGNTLGTTTDTTYSSLEIVNDDDDRIKYSANDWQRVERAPAGLTVDQRTARVTGEFNQDVHVTRNNGAYYTYDFDGESIVVATSKAGDQGDIEIFIDGVPRDLKSTYDGNNFRQVQQIIFEDHNLSPGAHTLKVVKRSGKKMVADVVLSKAAGGRINNTDNSIKYQGSWHTSSRRGHGDFGDDVAYTFNNGASFSYTFTGNKVQYIAPKASDQGEAEVFIDGHSKGIVDTHAENRAVRQVIFESEELADGEHTVKVVKRSGQFMLLDALKAVTTPFTQLNNTHARITYSGVWGTSSGRSHGDIEDDVRYTTQNGASMKFTFTGRSFRFIGPKASDQGQVEVFLDGVPQGLFDTYSKGRQVQEVIYEVLNLPKGEHTIEIFKHSGDYMLVDAIQYK